MSYKTISSFQLHQEILRAPEQAARLLFASGVTASAFKTSEDQPRTDQPTTMPNPNHPIHGE
jgi:hypothetical protein